MKILAYALTLALMIVIGFLTLTPVSASMPSGNDKIYHMIAFAALCFPIAAVNPRAILWLLPVATGFGGLIELIQPYVGRSAEWLDLLADFAGALIGSAVAGWLGWQWRSKASN